jgi:hypothetical protein
MEQKKTKTQQSTVKPSQAKAVKQAQVKAAAPKEKKEREYLTAITICGGIITLIDMNGNICYYRQRGIKRFTDQQRQLLIANGFLQKNWEQFKELPGHISISFEDPEIMGRARATYPNIDELVKVLNCRTKKPSGKKA